MGMELTQARTQARDRTRGFPVGIRTFEEVRTGGYTYIDKTSYIYDLAQKNAGKYYFLNRPPRFGKSLLVSTMQAYFEGRRDLFEGLAVERFEPSWERRPVLRFDFGATPGSSESACESGGVPGSESGGAWGGEACGHVDFRGRFDSVLGRAESVYGRDPKASTPGTRLYSLVRRAYDRAGKGVVVLVDDYDALLLAAADDPARTRETRIAMGEFYDALKACDAWVHLAFVTGVTEFPRLGAPETAGILGSINLRDIGMRPDYAGICGVTGDELFDRMTGDVDALADKLGVSRDEALECLRKRCGGYRFARTSPEVFDPYGLMRAFAEACAGGSAFDDGEAGPSREDPAVVPAPVAAALRARGWDLAFLEGLEADASEFDAPPDEFDALLPMLYQLGYLTVKSYDPFSRAYTLGIPNEGARSALSKALPYEGAPSEGATVEDLPWGRCRR